MILELAGKQQSTRLQDYFLHNKHNISIDLQIFFCKQEELNSVQNALPLDTVPTVEKKRRNDLKRKMNAFIIFFSPQSLMLQVTICPIWFLLLRNFSSGTSRSSECVFLTSYQQVHTRCKSLKYAYMTTDYLHLLFFRLKLSLFFHNICMTG